MASSKSVEQRNASETKKADRERDALIATREYHAEKARVDANTERLRALRLAKEATNAQVTAKPAVEKKTAVRNPARRSAKSRTSP